jgi:hypothetical protein
MRTLRERGFKTSAFIGTMSIIHTHPPASNANRWADACSIRDEEETYEEILDFAMYLGAISHVVFRSGARI